MLKKISLTPVGKVSSPISKPVDKNWGKVISTIYLKPQYASGLLGLQDFSHAIIITFLHYADFDLSKDLQRHPRNMKKLPKVGIFSQRAKNRPNPLGITVVELIEVGKDFLKVRGLDAIHDTPILDIKPYYPHYDKIVLPSVPHWVDKVMKDYF